MNSHPPTAAKAVEALPELPAMPDPRMLRPQGTFNAADMKGFASGYARAAVSAALAAAQAEQAKPIDMVLYCPKCGLQHIDEPDERTPGWKNGVHRSHLCHGDGCGHIWRPADVPTNGVAAVKTTGKADSPLATPPQPPSPDVERQAVGWIDEFGNVFPLGSWKPAKRTWQDEHKAAWRPLYTVPPQEAGDADAEVRMYMAILAASRAAGPIFNGQNALPVGYEQAAATLVLDAARIAMEERKT